MFVIIVQRCRNGGITRASIYTKYISYQALFESIRSLSSSSSSIDFYYIYINISRIVPHIRNQQLNSEAH